MKAIVNKVVDQFLKDIVRVIYGLLLAGLVAGATAIAGYISLNQVTFLILGVVVMGIINILLVIIARHLNRKSLFHHYYSVEDLQRYITQSKTVFLWGATWRAYIPHLENHLRAVLPDHAVDVRFLVIKPKSYATVMAAFRASANISERKIQEETLENNLNILRRLKRLDKSITGREA